MPAWRAKRTANKLYIKKKQQESHYDAGLCGLSNIRLMLSSADNIGVQPSLSSLFTSAPACTCAKTRVHRSWFVYELVCRLYVPCVRTKPAPHAGHLLTPRSASRTRS